MTTEQKQRTLGAGIVALLALGYYAYWMAGYAFPGLWTEALLAMKGESPFRPLSRPLWQLAMAPFAGGPGAGLVTAANVFSVLCGAFSVGLAYLVAHDWRTQPARTMPEADRQRLQDYRRLAGWVTALYLAFSMPLLVVATRAHPLALDLALLLAATLCTLRYRDRVNVVYWWLFGLVSGLGLAEYPTFLVAAPVFLVWWAWIFWRTRSFRWSRLAGGLAFLGAGASLGLLFCAWYAGTETAEWRGFTGFLQVYRHFLIETYMQLRYSVPRTGWILVGFTTLLPAVYIFWSGHQEADDLFTNIGLYLFRLVLLVVAVGILFNLPGSPWKLIGPSALLVAPYAITALWVGQLVAFLLQAVAWTRPRTGRPTRVRKVARLLGWAVAGATLLAAGFLNGRVADPRAGRALNVLADDLVRALQGRTWLVTQGSFDAMLQWRGHALGVPVKVLNLSSGRSAFYLRYVESLFDDPALKSLAAAGLDPLLTKWLTREDAAWEQVALFGHPDLWAMRGLAARPAGGLYVGYPADREAAPLSDQERDDSLAFLARHAGWLDTRARAPLLLDGLYKELRRMLGMYANNLGFTLDIQQQPEAAEKAYRQATAFDPNNLSALLNLSGLLERTGRTQEVALVQADLEAAQKRQPYLASTRAAAAVYGWLNSKAMLVEEASLFIEQGAAGLGLTRIQQALPDDQRQILLGRALSQMDRGDMEQSAETLEKLLELDPNHAEGLRYLFKARLNQRRFEECETLLNRLQQTELPRPAWLLEKAYLLVEQGRYEEAAPLFRELTAVAETSGPAWSALHRIAELRNDTELWRESVEGLKQSTNHVPGLLILVKDALALNDTATATLYLNQARRLQPGHPEVLSQGILLDSRMGDYASLWAKTRTLLNLDPMSAIGNYVVAERYLEEDRVDMAEAAMRRALSRGPFPDGLNGLAWILFLQGRYAEGLPLAQQAVASRNAPPIFYSTCGMLLFKSGQLNEAAAMLEQGIEKSGGQIPILKLHLAEVYFALGKTDEARNLVNGIKMPDRGWNIYEKQSLERMKSLAAQ